MRDKIKSAIKKAENLDIKAYNEGRKNYKSGSMEDVAAARAEICASCDKNVVEPIDDLKVNDSIDAVCGKMCDVCGCSLPYLIRQNVKKCSLNKW